MPEYALSNKINHAHERIDAVERALSGAPAAATAAVTRQEFDWLADSVAKLRGEIQALKMRLGKKAA